MKEESVMIIIPEDEECAGNPEIFMNNLESDENIHVIGTSFEEWCATRQGDSEK